MTTLALVLMVAAAASPPKVNVVEQAMVAYKKGAYADAIKSLKKALAAKTVPAADVVRAKVLLGAAQWGGGEVATAKVTVEALIAAHPDAALDAGDLSRSYARFLETRKRVFDEAKAPKPAAASTTTAPAAMPPPAPTPAVVVETPVAAPPAMAPKRPTITRVAILDPTVEGDTQKKDVGPFMQALASEANKLVGMRIISASDLRDLLGLEREKQLLGCGSEESCLAEMAGALDVDEMISVTVATAGSTATVTCSRLAVRTSRVLQRDTRTIEKSGGAELLALVGKQIQALYPDLPLREGKTRGVDTETLRRLIPPPLPRWVFFSTAGATLLAAGAAGVVGLQMRAVEADYNRLAAGSTNEPIAGADLKRLENQGKSLSNIANGLFIGAAAFGVASVVVAFLTDWSGPAAQSIALVPTSGGATVVVGGTW